MPESKQSGEPKQKPRRSIKIVLITTSVIFGLLVAEIALRVVGFSYPVFYVTDEARGYALRPGATGWYRKEGESFVRINSDGLRDREHAKQKPPRTFRIAVVGDSYAEALQVEQDEAFWAVMEHALQECQQFNMGRRVEVINFGVSGYGTAQQLITLRTKVFDYSPDLVLLALTTNNDVTDNLRALKKTDEVPYFVMREGRLVADNSFLESRAFKLRNSALNRLGRFLRDNLRIIQLAHQSHGAIKAQLARLRSHGARDSQEAQKREPASEGKDDSRQTQTNASAPVEELGADNLIYREPSDTVWTEAWLVTEELLKTMRDEVNARGARFVVVTLSNGIQVYPDREARTAFLRRVGANDIFYPELRIKHLGEREGFTVVNLAPALQQYADANHAFLHGFGAELGNGHWNKLGHRIAGEMLAEKFCAKQIEDAQH